MVVLAECDDSNRLAYLTTRNIKFSGVVVNKNMLSAALLFDGKLHPDIMHILQAIEHNHGRDVFNGGYVKLKSVVAQCSKEAATVIVDPMSSTHDRKASMRPRVRPRHVHISAFIS